MISLPGTVIIVFCLCLGAFPQDEVEDLSSDEDDFDDSRRKKKRRKKNKGQKEQEPLKKPKGLSSV